MWGGGVCVSVLETEPREVCIAQIPANAAAEEGTLLSRRSL